MLMPGFGTACRPRPAKRRGRMPLPPLSDGSGLSRREVLAGAGGTGLLVAVGAGALRAPAASAASRTVSASDGTPEQVHLTWGNDPATSVVVSWASPGRAVRPRVVLDRGRAGGR